MNETDIVPVDQITGNYMDNPVWKSAWQRANYLAALNNTTIDFAQRVVVSQLFPEAFPGGEANIEEAWTYIQATQP